MRTKLVSLTSSVARLLSGLTAVVVVSLQVQAQQSVYYPPASNQSAYYDVQPATQYYQASYAPRNYQYSYAPKYYQAASATQYYQAPQYYQAASATQYYQAPQYYQAAEPTQTTATATSTPVVPASYTVPVADAPASQPVQAAPEATYGDPYGFLYWLNSTRASYGLGPVNYDQNLSNWAAMNNSEQMARGLGHFVMGPARHQNSAAGGEFPGAMWMASPAHRAALLDPTISWIGIAAAGAYWTFNAN